MLYTRINNLYLPIDLQIKLFDHTVLPIMTYSCEVFGFENVQILERIHTGFLRRITRTKKCTPLYMLYGELGRYPIEIIIKSRMVNFWNRIITGKQEKLSYKLYQAVRYLLPQSSKWICFIRQILSDVGRYDLWLYQNNIQSTKISKDIKQILLEQNYLKFGTRSSKSLQKALITTFSRTL